VRRGEAASLLERLRQPIKSKAIAAYLLVRNRGRPLFRLMAPMANERRPQLLLSQWQALWSRAWPTKWRGFPVHRSDACVNCYSPRAGEQSTQ